MGEAVAFALVTHWLSKAISYLWSSWTGAATLGFFERLMMMTQRSSSIDVFSRRAQWANLHPTFWTWFKGVGSVIADPFTTCITLFVTAFFVFVGARILVRAEGQRLVTFESAVKIVAYMTSISIFSIIPFVGPLITWIYSFYIGVIGARELYGVRNGRAVVIILFPELLVWGAIAVVVFAIALMMMGIFFSLVHF